MAHDEVVESDKSIGVAIVLGVIAVAGAAAMLVEPGSVLGAYGFAVAIAVGSLLVVALHAYAPR